jgi:hypothetical protein
MPGNWHVRFGKRRNETDRRKPTRRVAPTSPWPCEPATIAVSMAIDRPQAINDAPARAGAQRRMEAEDFLIPRGMRSLRAIYNHARKSNTDLPPVNPVTAIDWNKEDR